ncbi:conjugal transfer protein TrbF, partial [Rhizobium sp. H41]
MAANRPPDSPYLAARQEWTERYGSYVQAARAWRIVGILGLSMAVIGFTYAMYLSTQVKLVPYIVEVDKLGTSVTAGFPQQIEYADARVVRATLGNFITSLKSITPDAVVQKQYIDRTYALLRTSDPSTQKINAWFRGNSPFEKAK